MMLLALVPPALAKALNKLVQDELRALPSLLFFLLRGCPKHDRQTRRRPSFLLLETQQQAGTLLGVGPPRTGVGCDRFSNLGSLCPTLHPLIEHT